MSDPVTFGPNDRAIMQEFSKELWSDIASEKSFHKEKPLLAHYASIHTLESILKNMEIWFSNPLYMNDHEEVRFGIYEGQRAFMNSPEIAVACKTPQRTAILYNAFNNYFSKFEQEHVLDTYLVCLSRHDRQDNDGILSMWRGYGADGNGAAIVVDTSKFTHRENSPLIIAPVAYSSSENRRQWIINKIEALGKLISTLPISDDKLYIPAYAFFERLKIFALFTKHPGFREEDEWRVVYLPERDTTKAFFNMIDYAIGPRGIEGKLKLKLAPLAGVLEEDFSLDKIINRIILGPTISSPLACEAVRKMLNRHAPSLIDRVVTSSIPFRP